MLNFRRIQSFVAVFEEGSFSRAAERANATQSGLSMQVGALEKALGLRLFERVPKGVVPTQAGERLYRRATAILRSLGEAEAELAALASEVSGRIRVGLMPAFTHAIVAPALAGFLARYPNVDVAIIEAYSPALAAGVARGEFDFALVPSDQGESGLKARPFGFDRELLVSGPASGLAHLEPLRLAALPPLNLVLPTRGNARRERLDAFFAANDVKVAAVLEMDAMSATLDYVAASDWKTILPATICTRDIDGRERRLSPIASPSARVDYVLVEPLRRALSPSAALFAEALYEAFEELHKRWDQPTP